MIAGRLERGLKIVEKIPFFVASIADSIVTYLVHLSGRALPSLQQIPISVRLENALVSYVVYIFQMIWPAKMAVYYPYPLGSLLLPAITAGMAIGATTALAIREFPRRPYLMIGWLWYLLTLVPVIGLIQAGAQARADRFTYIPMIGISIAVVWGIAEVLGDRRRIQFAVSAAACLACLVLTWVQVGYWRDSVSLYQHAIDVTTNNYLAHFNLAAVLDGRGDSRDAITNLRAAVRINPNFALAHAELGQLLVKPGQSEEALLELQTAVELQPNSADAHFRLGSVLGSLGRTEAAASEFSRTIEVDPENADAHYNLGTAFAQADKVQEAVREFGAAVRLKPNDADAHFMLGIAFARLGRTEDAFVQLSEAVRIRPDFTDASQALEELKGSSSK